MRLHAFRVQNYKKIRDTGWVSCEDLTVFVGKNEAGKSAIFRGLSKLNPSDGAAYDGLKEFPRRRYTDEFARQDWPVSSGDFTLSTAERAELASTTPLLRDVERATVTRHYSGTRTVSFTPQPNAHDVQAGEARAALQAATDQIQNLTAPEGKGAALGAIKQAILPALHGAMDNLPTAGTVTKAQLAPAIETVSVQVNEAWQRRLFRSTLTALDKLAERADAAEKLPAARQWVVTRMPRFIYFDRYDILDSAIHIPTFVQQLKNTAAAPRVRTTHCLFQHVGLNPQQIATLGQHHTGEEESEATRRQVDERAILASSASNAMTEKFAIWWEQRRHKFRYQFDGDYFRVWVSDDLDPSEIELDQRSVGMQYFFSFFIVFLVESADGHANSILLIDEPALQLHGTAQMSIVAFLEKLSMDNQALYSTHSPFMVQVDHLERARAVFEGADGTTQVSEDVWPRDKDTLFPLQAALGYQLAQGLFIGRRQVVIEGLTDLWLLQALNHALGAQTKTQLRHDIVLVPSAGVVKLLPLASMLIGHGVEVAALLDGDEPARREGKKLTEHLLADNAHRCLFIGDFVGIASAELEDLFPEAHYLAAVREVYPQASVQFTPDEQRQTGVVSKLEALFNRRQLGRFEKWRVAEVLRDHILTDPTTVPEETLATTETIFIALNQLFD